MGGCASKPKEFDGPADAPISSDTTAQSSTNGGESQIEKPAVDGSEPEKKAQTAVSAETDAGKSVKPAEDDAKADDKNAEDKVEATPKQEAEEPEHKSNDAPSKEEVKSEAPLASL
ncbi:hypothetical protein ERO13_A08G106200v2 [Gossypium hirsutum]|uniref:Uncharacterized protein n=5 Tax=Gossypium TaxID=3633 RepID=A0A2P5XW75_GOSBA|nr:uncharacterized protein LOC107921798 [Gossypium hirsutum]KAB2069857.1 hypothetical protein ES319_A08G119800v1 [Gossypium barbadense]TYH06101.1 hypothetical protein ES288_A08G131500v1 [Gossypium darwinii]TYI14585.1 hypothetical protein ES332_A08G130800v1 [Gossypium tomentosum]TYJ22443.1 hypothetical protein E1A91_A08G126000v1 [Gossypium mustelinum]KAG4187584.1 hypothetical protein ERO13_A08G106200v2 [Gossypium hirsutum]